MEFRGFSLDELRSVFSADPVTGRLLRKASFHEQFVGSVPDSYTHQGYRRVTYRGVEFREHQLIWVLCTSQPIPDGMTIDHINGIRDDNRLENLRLADALLQASNREVNRDGHLVGTTFDKDVQKWVAKFSITDKSFRRGRKEFFLGYYDTMEDAHKAYCDAVASRETTVATCLSKIEERKAKRQSGHNGVKWHKDHEKWAASVSVERKNYHCGYYDDKEEAAEIFEFINVRKREYVDWLLQEKARTGKRAIYDAVEKFIKFLGD